MSILKKLIHVCSKNSIVKFLKTDTNNILLQYGSLGSLLKKNIFNEWFYSYINSNDVILLPLEIVKSHNQNISLTEFPERSKNCLIKDVIGNYYEMSSLIEHNLPFGFAAYGPSVSSNLMFNKASYFTEGDFKLKDFISRIHITVIFFCPPKKSMNWFYYWIKQRYLWWRKLSNIPSQFSMSEIVKSSTNDHHLSLLLDFPWGKDRLETVILYEDSFVKEMFQEYCRQNGKEFIPTSSPSVIMCETSLDLSVLAYLSNSFFEKWRDKKSKDVLQLHYKLAPYKVCLLLEEEEEEIMNKLKTVANHLMKELKEKGVPLFPVYRSKLSSLAESLYSQFDEMGVPYIIVLNKISLQTGVAGLRNRDTTLQNSFHIFCP